MTYDTGMFKLDALDLAAMLLVAFLAGLVVMTFVMAWVDSIPVRPMVDDSAEA